MAVRAEEPEIPDDNIECTGSATCRILLFDLDTGFHMAMFRGYKRLVKSFRDRELC
jgi:hypothetical protein